MSSNRCPEPEWLFDDSAPQHPVAVAHAHSCEACQALLEEHRQLEKDLLRLADPLPPPDFVQQVMAKVAAAPSPVRSELWWGAGILVAALVACVGALLTLGGPGDWAVWVVDAMVAGREVVLAILSAVAAVWSVVTAPVIAALILMFLACIWALKRLAAPANGLEVQS